MNVTCTDAGQRCVVRCGGSAGQCPHQWLPASLGCMRLRRPVAPYAPVCATGGLDQTYSYVDESPTSTSPCPSWRRGRGDPGGARRRPYLCVRRPRRFRVQRDDSSKPSARSRGCSSRRARPSHSMTTATVHIELSPNGTQLQCIYSTSTTCQVSDCHGMAANATRDYTSWHTGVGEDAVLVQAGRGTEVLMAVTGRATGSPSRRTLPGGVCGRGLPPPAAALAAASAAAAPAAASAAAALAASPPPPPPPPPPRRRPRGRHRRHFRPRSGSTSSTRTTPARARTTPTAASAPSTTPPATFTPSWSGQSFCGPTTLSCGSTSPT